MWRLKGVLFGRNLLTCSVFSVHMLKSQVKRSQLQFGGFAYISNNFAGFPKSEKNLSIQKSSQLAWNKYSRGNKIIKYKGLELWARICISLWNYLTLSPQGVLWHNMEISYRTRKYESGLTGNHPKTFLRGITKYFKSLNDRKVKQKFLVIFSAVAIFEERIRN